MIEDVVSALLVVHALDRSAEGVDRDQGVAGDHLRLVDRFDLGLASATAPVSSGEDQLDAVGSAHVQVVGHQCLARMPGRAVARRTPWSTKTPIWRIDSYHQ